MMMKSLFSSFISENFCAPQRESNPCLPIAGTVVLPLDYRVSDGKYDVRDLVRNIDMPLSYLKAEHTCMMIFCV